MDNPCEQQETEPNPIHEWRTEHERIGNLSLYLERVFYHLGLPPVFTVYGSRLDWCVNSYTPPEGERNSIPEFRRMVARIVDILGPADKVDARHYWGQAYANQAPDLIAEWTIDAPFPSSYFGGDKITVMVRLMSPKGCLIKPGTEYRPAQVEQEAVSPELHPQCVQAIKELEDL